MTVSEPRSQLGTTTAALAAEGINVRSTPTAPALLAGSVVMAVASCLANLAVTDRSELADPDTLQRAMHASTVATLVFALVAGIVFSTSDFRFGRIDQLLLSDPRRGRLVRSKAIVGAAVGLVYGTVGAAAAVGAISGYFAANGTTLNLGTSEVWQPVVGVIVGASLFAVLGVGVGFAVQNQPAAIAGALACMLIVEPTALLGLPSVGRWLPGAAGLALTRSPDPNLHAQTAGLGLLLLWAIGALIIANSRLIRTDI